MSVTQGLRDTWAGTAQGREWLASHETMKDAAAARWDLRLGPLYEGSNVSFVWPAWRADGKPVVLKLNFPEPETEHEADALRHWNGCGAVRLIEYDSDSRALLIERCEPGEQLWSLPEDEALAVATQVLRTLRIPAPKHGPFRALDDVAGRWAVEIPDRWQALGRPFEHELIDGFGRLIEDLFGFDDEPVVLHQDFHGGNILSTGDDWLAIDPKPLLGDPAFDAASFLRDRRAWLLGEADPAAILRRRLDRLASDLDLDRDRILGWAVVHALAWGVDDDRVYEDMIECARLMLALARVIG